MQRGELRPLALTMRQAAPASFEHQAPCVLPRQLTVCRAPGTQRLLVAWRGRAVKELTR
jgi:hypothetical protein